MVFSNMFGMIEIEYEKLQSLQKRMAVLSINSGFLSGHGILGDGIISYVFSAEPIMDRLVAQYLFIERQITSLVYLLTTLSSLDS